tara:strand:+ start:154 stop:516 length:363 start_codon:yes stop_codon:yes gene_type:complete
MIIAFKETKTIYVHVPVESKPKEKIEYRYITKYKTVTEKSKKPKTKPQNHKRRSKPKTQNNAKPSVNINSKMINDVASGLKNLGIPKKQGADLAKKLCLNTNYNSSEKLFEDCLSELKKT